jgi:hypothetical protein
VARPSGCRVETSLDAADTSVQATEDWHGLVRSKLSLEVIERNLDGMAAVKLNVLHLHLAED